MLLLHDIIIVRLVPRTDKSPHRNQRTAGCAVPTTLREGFMAPSSFLAGMSIAFAEVLVITVPL